MSPADVLEMPVAKPGVDADLMMRVLNVGLRLLSARVYQWATLLLVAGAFAYALWQPTTPRIVTAVLFTGLVHLPTWWRKDKP